MKIQFCQSVQWTLVQPVGENLYRVAEDGDGVFPVGGGLVVGGEDGPAVLGEFHVAGSHLN